MTVIMSFLQASHLKNFFLQKEPQRNELPGQGKNRHLHLQTRTVPPMTAKSGISF
jgi:hypothetical protein